MDINLLIHGEHNDFRSEKNVNNVLKNGYKNTSDYEADGQLELNQINSKTTPVSSSKRSQKGQGKRATKRVSKDQTAKTKTQDIVASDSNQLQLEDEDSRDLKKAKTHHDSDQSSTVLDIDGFFKLIKANKDEDIDNESITFVDRELPNIDSLTGDQDKDRAYMISLINERYAAPMLKEVGYKWVRKEVPSKGRGLKVFTIKYRCAQESTKPIIAKPGRSRQLARPLKEFNCDSYFCIKYSWATQEVNIIYKHKHHPFFKVLPEEVKPFILKRLDKRALDVYNELMETEEFKHLRDGIHFFKVQSYWSRMRITKKDEDTKQAFRSFLNK